MRTVGIAACSNGLKKEARREIRALEDYLLGLGCEVRESPFLYERENGISGTGQEKARALMDLFADPDITDIFDVSGGDMANEVLDFLDFEKIQNSGAAFWGYSDLTTVLNAVFQKTGKPGVLYCPRNLVGGDFAALQRQRLEASMPLFAPEIRMVQGESLSGILVGGNIRCLLKLAGTEYFPSLQDRVLLLEARSGGVPQLVTYLSQLRSLGAFRQIRGILLGTFSQLDREGIDVVPLIKDFAGPELPVGKTGEIGHGADSRAIWIGREIGIP